MYVRLGIRGHAQQLLRDGEHEPALRNYQARDRIIITHEQRQGEDAALEAAHAERRTGTPSLVIAQTSNEHLDALNARAQAIRLQASELERADVRLAYVQHPFPAQGQTTGSAHLIVSEQPQHRHHRSNGGRW